MYALEFRKAVVQLYYFFNSMRKTSHALKISIASISRWTKNINPKKYNRKTIKTSDALKSFVVLKLSEKPYMSCIELCECIYSTFNIHISKQLVHTIIKTSGLSYKRIRKRGTSQQKQERILEFKNKMKNLSKDSIIVSIDESGFSHEAYPIYGYSKKGTQVILEYPITKDRKHYSLILAITNTGLKHFTIHTTYTDAKSFNDFIMQLPFPKNSILLMDNASIHKTKTLFEILKLKDYQIIYTPPYSPEYNPIELVFGNIKHHYYKTKYINKIPIYKAIETLTNNISVNTIQNCFKHVLNKIF